MLARLAMAQYCTVHITYLLFMLWFQPRWSFMFTRLCRLTYFLFLSAKNCNQCVFYTPLVLGKLQALEGAPLPSPPFSSPPLPSLPLPLEVGPLNPATGSGVRCKLPQRVCGGAPAEIDFGAF